MTSVGDAASAADVHLLTLGRLTRGALHEIANPLLALLGTAEFALADAEPGTKLRSRVELMHETGSEIGEIVRALQNFIRSASAPPERLSLAESARTTLALVRRVTAERDVELALRVEAEPFVHASPGDVQQRLVELLLDGLAAAERDDTVELLVREQDGEAVASVGDFELRLPVSVT